MINSLLKGSLTYSSTIVHSLGYHIFFKLSNTFLMNFSNAKAGAFRDARLLIFIK